MGKMLARKGRAVLWREGNAASGSLAESLAHDRAVPSHAYSCDEEGRAHRRLVPSARSHYKSQVAPADRSAAVRLENRSRGGKSSEPEECLGNLGAGGFSDQGRPLVW